MHFTVGTQELGAETHGQALGVVTTLEPVLRVVTDIRRVNPTPPSLMRQR